MNNCELKIKTAKLKTKPKFVIRNLSFVILFVFIIFAGIGFFGGVKKAQATPAPGICQTVDRSTSPAVVTSHPEITTTEDCNKLKVPPNIGIQWAAAGDTTKAATPTQPTAFEKEVGKNLCGLGITDNSTFWPGCFIQLFYAIFYVIPGWLLWVSAYFFNVLISITLSSAFFKQDFVSEAWAVVRDLSNIFFILILLYISVKLILSMGGHGVKEMIAKVVVLALLINFSMFFTGVIIDATNMLALVFYNKLQVSTVDANGKERPYQQTGLGEKKDVAGGLVNAFNPTKLISQEYLNSAKTHTVTVAGTETTNTTGDVAPGILIGMLLITGVLMLFAAYCLFATGFSFLGRMIELFILIIFSPFAFMSSTVPKLAGVKELGWDAWLSRLLKSALMAPIFMFFLYFIFMLIKANIFGGLKTATTGKLIESILGIILPAVLILVLLMKATKYAKEGAGEIGTATIGAAKLVAGIAVGGAALGTAALGRATVGATAKAVQASDATRRNAMTFKDTRDKWSSMNKANLFAYLGLAGTAISGIGKAATSGAAQLAHTTPLGKKWKEADEGFGHKEHATHILDAKMKQEFGHVRGYENAKYKDLTETEQKAVKKEVEKDEMAKFTYGDVFNKLQDPQKQTIMRDYDQHKRAIANSHGDTIGIGTAPGNAIDRNGALVAGGTEFKSDYFTRMAKANMAVGEFVQALRKGSYDIRNLPDMSAKTKGFPKMGVAMVTAVAAGVRLGLKKGGGVEYGTPQKNIFKDIGNTITEALKNVKINVGGGGGHGGGHDDGHTKEVKSVGH